MPVAIVKTTEPGAVRDAMALIGGMGQFVQEGDRVIIKPNICVGKASATGAVTDPQMVAEVCRMVAECGGHPTVAESPIYPFSTKRSFKGAGYGDFEAEHGYPIIDLDSCPHVHVNIPKGKAIRHSVIAKPILECDKLIDMPVMKTHFQTLFTLGMKNLKGVVPGKHKHIIHIAGLDEGIVDLNTIVRPTLTIADGIVGMEGEMGPVNGAAVAIGVIVAGGNVVEVDSVCARIMGADPKDVRHIALAAERGLGRIKDVEIVGAPIDQVRMEIALPQKTITRGRQMEALIRASCRLRNPLERLLGRDAVETRRTLERLAIDMERCTGCKICVKACPVGALEFDERLRVNEDECIQCFCCMEVCTEGALSKTKASPRRR